MFCLLVYLHSNGMEWDIVRKSTVDVTSKGYAQYFNVLKNANSMLVNKIDEIRDRQNQVPDNFISEIQRWSLEGQSGKINSNVKRIFNVTLVDIFIYRTLQHSVR